MLGQPIATYPVATGSTASTAPTAPATVGSTIRIAMGDANGPAANIQGVRVSFAAGTGPDDAGPYLFQSASVALDAAGVLAFTLAPGVIATGASGVLCVLLPDGRRLLRIVTVP